MAWVWENLDVGKKALRRHACKTVHTERRKKSLLRAADAMLLGL